VRDLHHLDSLMLHHFLQVQGKAEIASNALLFVVCQKRTPELLVLDHKPQWVFHLALVLWATDEGQVPCTPISQAAALLAVVSDDVCLKLLKILLVASNEHSGQERGADSDGEGLRWEEIANVVNIDKLLMGSRSRTKDTWIVEIIATKKIAR
jgi:hypothetical protein